MLFDLRSPSTSEALFLGEKNTTKNLQDTKHRSFLRIPHLSQPGFAPHSGFAAVVEGGGTGFEALVYLPFMPLHFSKVASMVKCITIEDHIRESNGQLS